jgi:hypothetical protein
MISVWLFVTEQKTSDRTQYEDRLDGDELRWHGQPEDRKDKLIIEHQAEGIELLLFYRESRKEYPPWWLPLRGPISVRQPRRRAPPTRFVLRRLS